MIPPGSTVTAEASPERHPSEELIGQFFKESGRRDQAIIATKIPPRNRKWPAWKGIPIAEVFPNEYIEKCVDDSLRSLGVETIDLVQFHVWQDISSRTAAGRKPFSRMTKAGKVRYWGISANDYQPSNCLRALDAGLISTVQFIFNIFHREPTEKLLSYAAKNNIGLIARVHAG